MSFFALAQTKSVKIDVSAEKAGAEPTHFLPIVGNWIVTKDGAKNVLMVDGRQWKRGDPSGGLADKARAIYGSKHEDFIDNVKAFAYFPYAIAQGVDDFRNGEISMRFQMVDGALDSCAGILFNVKPNGDYLTVRFNGKEDNLVLWTFNKGTRKFVKKGSEDVPLKRKEWYAMKIAVQGTKLEGYPEWQEAARLHATRSRHGQGRRLVEDRQRQPVRRFHRRCAIAPSPGVVSGVSQRSLLIRL